MDSCLYINTVQALRSNVARCQAGTRMTWSISHHHTLLRISMDILGTAVTRSKQTLRAITWCLQMKHVPKSSKITYHISIYFIPHFLGVDPQSYLPGSNLESPSLFRRKRHGPPFRAFHLFKHVLPLKVRPTKANSDRHVGTWRLASPQTMLKPPLVFWGSKV